MLKSADSPEQKFLSEILSVKIEYYKRYLREQSLLTGIKLICRALAEILR